MLGKNDLFMHTLIFSTQSIASLVYLHDLNASLSRMNVCLNLK